MKRKPLTKEHRKKLSLAHKGIFDGSKNPFYGKKHSQETRNKISLAGKGRKDTEETRNKKSESNKGKHKYWLGKKMSVETRKKMSFAHKGEKAPNWRGGVTKINQIIRTGLEYRLWREAVFMRDNWTCIWCNKRGGILNADHIKPFAYFPELRFSIDNGRTLCRECHLTTNTYAGKIANNFYENNTN